ncbi:YciI family protein [Nocardioides sp.]|uniref:YciI family protein n=1 Tax=Nocardioides sp. TaxID=35761 RepID=UPI003D0F5050
MTEYVVLIPGNEDAWAAASLEDKAEMYAKHSAFAAILAERGHKVTSGAELTHSKTSRLVTGGLDAVSVTDGPYAESVEQLTGFYVVDSDDLDDLLKCVGKLTEGGGAVEVRECVDHSGDM